MKRKASARSRSHCPIRIALDLVGDSWTLLIVRDLLFKGRKTYGDFLGAEEGIATNILADRLARLEAGGIVGKRRDDDDARRFVYHLTDKGLDLAPVLVELVLWSAKYERTDAPPEVVARMRANRGKFIAGAIAAHRPPKGSHGARHG